MTLGIRKSLGYSVLDSYTGVALQLAGTVVMARLLTPEQVGTFTVAAVFSAIAAAVRNFGMSEFLIQERQVTDDAVRAANGVVWLVSWALGVALQLAAYPLAWFYGVPGLTPLLQVLSISFFLTPFAAMTLAHFRRELQLRPIFITNVVSNSIALAVGIVLALRGHGAMSLAWSTVLGTASAVAISLAFRPRTLPLRPALAGTRRLFDFGKHVTGVYAFGQVGAGAPEAIIGKAADVASVAYFSRANGLIELFNKLVLQAVWPIVVPVLAQRARDTGSVRPAYLAGTAYLTAIAWPLLFLMGLLAYPAIRIVYGDQWLASVPQAQVLCIAAAIGVAYHLTKDTLLALGRARECNLLQIKVHAWRIEGVLLVIPFGLTGASWGIVAGTTIGVVLTHRALAEATGLRFRDVAASAWPSLRIAVLALLPAWLLVAAVPPSASNFLAVGTAGAALTAAAWGWLLHRSNHPLRHEAAEFLRRVRQRRLG